MIPWTPGWAKAGIEICHQELSALRPMIG